VNKFLRSFAPIAILVALFGVTTLAQRAGNKNDDAKLREREKAKAERDARRYDKLKTFALNLYQTDPEFREEVDDHFDSVQLDHSKQAFEKNVAPPARPTLVHDGDRLRLQTGLYDNKMVADYINRVGQRLVPADSDKLFAFRLVAYPIPFAETLSTGTIYVSTGLVSLLDNEAQLAFVLAHEMAHAELDHWKLKSMLLLARDDFDKKEGAKRRLIGLGIGAALGVATGKATGGDAATTAQWGVAGAALGFSIAGAWNSALTLDWDTVQENEADEAAFRSILRQNYEVREVPKLYATLQRSVKQDQRVGLAFMGNRRRTAERLANAQDVIGQSMKADIDARPGKLTVTHPDFVRVMSALKRDNGILSFYHDMFQLAKSNLEYARANRPNDPAAHYYYGKVMKLVGRSDEDRKLADEAFQRAIQFDHRERNYGAHFYRALALIDQKNAGLNPEIAKELQAYLMASMRFASEEASVANALPANLDDLYDYLTEVGDVRWRPIVPDAMKPALIQAGTETQKPESPLNRAPAARPTPAVKK
jgi:predicted Zn-dependent protease